MDLIPQVLDLLVKVLWAALCGGLLGLERELHHKPAGLRTNVLIACGACVFVYLSGEVARAAGVGDPGRIAAQIVTGIGFLGAGTIIQSQGIVKGLTSAATIWVVAGLGMCCGMNMPIPALVITIVILALLLLLGQVEIAIGVKGINKYNCTLVLNHQPTALQTVLDALFIAETKIEDLKIEREGGDYTLSFTHYDKRQKVDAVHTMLAALPEIRDFKIEFIDLRVHR